MHKSNTFSSGELPAVVKQLLSTSNALATNLQTVTHKLAL